MDIQAALDERDRRIAELERAFSAWQRYRQRDDDRCDGDREHEARVRIAQGLLDAMAKARHEFDALRGCGREER